MKAHFALWTLLLLTILVSAGCDAPPERTPESAPLPVHVELLEPGDFEPAIELLGTVVARGRTPIQVPSAGTIRYAARFRSGLKLGASVSKGEPLFVVVDLELDHAMAKAEIELRSAATEMERARKGVEEGFMPAIQLQQAELQHELSQTRVEHGRETKDRLQVLAPESGYLVVEELIAEGSEVSVGTVVGHVGQDGLPRVEGLLASSDVSAVVVGMKAEAVRPGGSETVATLKVAEIAREADRTGLIRVLLAVEEDYDLPTIGEGVELRVLLPRVPGAISVPDEAVLQRAGLSFVYVLEPQGADFRASRRAVRQGSRRDRRIEIREGLKEGELIAVRGVDLLADGVVARDVGTDRGVSERTGS